MRGPPKKSLGLKNPGRYAAIVTLFRSLIDVLLCVQHNVKLCCLFWSCFAEEANVAHNNND